MHRVPQASLSFAALVPGRLLAVSLVGAGLLCATTLAGTAPVLAAPARREAAGAHPRNTAAPVQPPALAVRAEDHPGFTRLVLPAPASGRYQIVGDKGWLAVTYPSAKVTVSPATPVRNVAVISPSATQMLITATPGARITSRSQGRAVIVDIADPPAAAAPVAAPVSGAPPTGEAKATQAGVATSQAAGPAPQVPVTAAPLAPATPGDSPATAASAPDPAKAAAEAALLAPTATPIMPVTNTAQPAILLPAPGTGLAAFRLGSDLVIVLDAPIAFDTARIQQDPVFGQLTVDRTVDAAIIRIPRAAPTSVRLSKSQAGWTITAIPQPDPVLGIAPRLVVDHGTGGRMQLPAAQPSRSITIYDRATGSHILVGTQSDTGQGIANPRELVQFSLLSTIQGVAVDARSDDLTLRPEADGFDLSAGRHAGGAIISGMDPAAASVLGDTQLSRMFDFPDEPIKVLADRLAERVVAASDAPALGRGLPRERVAEAMVALGLDAEAQGAMEVAFADSPELRDQPQAIALGAIAAFMADRHPAGQGLADPRLSDPKLTGASEIKLWRALLAARQDEASRQAGRDLAATVPLLLAYPQPLRDRFLPMALQTMALSGQVAAARKILDKRPTDTSLDLARGMMHEMAGEPDAALQSYALVAGRADRLPRYKAMVRSVDVRLARGELGPREAADALDPALYAWRGEQEELALRIHMADLRRQTGQWREAISLLRDARIAFPDARARIDSELAGIFTALLVGGAGERMAPVEFVTLYDQNIDLLRQAPWSELAGTALVNRLVALDLPGRADPVLVQMIAMATDPGKRAVFGARLASVRLSANDPAGAVLALAQTKPPAEATLAPDVEQTRQLLYARAEAQRGNIDTAITMLTSIGSAEADDVRAGLCSARKDWKGAVAALSDLESKQLPADGDTLTTDQQAIVMRLASAATLASDQVTIDRLRTVRSAAMAKSPSAIPFRLITSTPVSGTADLPRAFEEIRLARQLQGRLDGTARP